MLEIVYVVVAFHSFPARHITHIVVVHEVQIQTHDPFTIPLLTQLARQKTSRALFRFVNWSHSIPTLSALIQDILSPFETCLTPSHTDINFLHLRSSSPPQLHGKKTRWVSTGQCPFIARRSGSKTPSTTVSRVYRHIYPAGPPRSYRVPGLHTSTCSLSDS